MNFAEQDYAIVPDHRLWGQGYGGREYTDEDLDEIANNVKPSGHKRENARWTVRSPHSIARLRGSNGRYLIPEGYDVPSHPNRRLMHSRDIDLDYNTSHKNNWQVPEQLSRVFSDSGLALDLHGRPINPNVVRLLCHPDIGMPTGIGYGFYFGNNVVTDVVLVTPDNSFLVIDRQSEGRTIPALVGGYVLPADYGLTMPQWKASNRPVTVKGIHAAARRILMLEAGIFTPPEAGFKIVRAIRPTSKVHTLNFWTTVYTAVVKLSMSQIGELDTQNNARFIKPRRRELTIGNMWPDHRRATVAALSFG
ncbi:MAG: hypothetical protein PVI21_00845 [Candidatus Woesebacteria bacterium]